MSKATLCRCETVRETDSPMLRYMRTSSVGPAEAIVEIESAGAIPVLPSHRDSPFIATIGRKISARLATRVPLEMRRLVNEKPMVSFTFDDVPASAHSEGAKRLEERGARGTFYIATNLIGRKTPDWVVIDEDGILDLQRKGHEIGVHTHRHRAVGWISGGDLRRELEVNRSELKRIHQDVHAQNFAYPYGMPSFDQKWRLSNLVQSSRGIHPGVNAGVFDAQFVKCVELADARLTPIKLGRYLDEVVAKNGWLVFLSHDVSACPSDYGCSFGLLQQALDGLARRKLEVVTIANALKQSVSFASAPRLKMRNRDLPSVEGHPQPSNQNKSAGTIRP